MMTCKANIETANGTLKCALDADHSGPVHQAKTGEAWGDATLPPAPPPDEDRSPTG